jgi:HrpA-like RNA helicase
MPLPTLYVPGNLAPTTRGNKVIGPDAKELSEHKPIDYIMDWFAKRLPKDYGGNPSIPAKSVADRILLLQSKTGSGKSTVLPPEFYHRFYDITRKNIACTQPRILTAKEMSEGILDYHTKEALTKSGHPSRTPLELGENIGYQTGVFSKKPTRGIVFMTIGIIQQQLNIMSDEEFMDKYSIIIIDEAHERSIGTDIVLFMMKNFISRHYKDKNCPFLLVMSATFDPFAFADYLLDSVDAPKRYHNIIQVIGSTYPIKENFLAYDSPNYIESVIEHIIQIHKNNPDDYKAGPKVLKESISVFKDILIFVSGAGDIRKLKKKINDLNATNPAFQDAPVLPLELTSDVVKADQAAYRNIFKDIEELIVEISKPGKNGIASITIKKPVRRVIVGTNVAETGVTIKTIKYLIDTGFHKSQEFNPSYAIDVLVNKPITLSMYQQRRGRVGRLAPGECFAMYTEKTMKAMQENQFPDIVKSEITLDILNILIKNSVEAANEKSMLELTTDTKIFKPDVGNLVDSYKPTNLMKMDILTIPPADSIHYSMEKLFTLGAIDERSMPTAVGFIMNKFRFITPESIRMILAGFAWDVSILDLITMAAFLQFNPGDIYPDDMEKQRNAVRRNGMFSFFPFPDKSSPITKNISDVKTKLMISDDFIQNLVVFYYMQQKITDVLDISESSETKTTRVQLNRLEKLRNWFEEVGINMAGMMNVIERRDVIINTMAMIGLDPFHNFHKSIYHALPSYSDMDKFKYIAGLKRCIFEGYKMNIAKWDGQAKSYITRKSHMQIKPKTEHGVKYIVFDSINYMQDPRSILYSPHVGFVSIMDGYISLDTCFDC